MNLSMPDSSRLNSRSSNGFSSRHPYAAILLTTVLLVVALGGAGTVLYLYGQQHPGSGGVVQQVQPTLLVFPFLAVWLGFLFFGRRLWRAVSPKPLGQLTAADWALCVVPLLVVVINVFDAHPSLARSAGQLAYYAAFCALVAFVEEGLYRGLFMDWLLPRGVTVALLVPTLAFALTHALNLLGGQSLADTAVQIVFALLFGAVAALLRLKLGSLLPLMLWHFLFDFVSFTGVTGKPNLPLEALSCVLLAGYAAWLYPRVAGRHVNRLGLA